MANDTASSREMWLSIALAVARDGLPEPRRLGLHDNIVSLTLGTHSDTRKWAARLGLGECELDDGSLWAPHYSHRGWSWQICCHQPDESPPDLSPLADQLVAAIETLGEATELLAGAK